MHGGRVRFTRTLFFKEGGMRVVLLEELFIALLELLVFGNVLDEVVRDGGIRLDIETT